MIGQIESQKSIQKIFETPSNDPSYGMISVIKGVFKVVKENQSSFVLYDCTEGGGKYSRFVIQGRAESCACNLGISVEVSTYDGSLEIELFDGDLSPGTPRGKSFCYRVNAFLGDSAKSYRGSTGFNFSENLVDNLVDDWVISDNWTETNLKASQALKFLNNIDEFEVPVLKKGYGVPKQRILG